MNLFKRICDIFSDDHTPEDETTYANDRSWCLMVSYGETRARKILENLTKEEAHTEFQKLVLHQQTGTSYQYTSENGGIFLCCKDIQYINYMRV